MSIKRETLLCGILCLFATIPAFAESDWLLAQTDRDQYHTGQEMEISGFVLDAIIPEIGIKIYDPENNIVGAYTVELELDDGFTRTVPLDSPSYDQSGLYIIEFTYGDQTDDLFFEVIGISEPESVPAPQPSSAPEVLVVVADKGTYRDGDFVKISGMVSEIGDPTILIGIFDPDNFPAGFYTPQISPDLEFETSFLVKNGVNFKKIGTYTVKANYGTSKTTTTFGFTDKPLAQNTPQNPPPEPTPAPPVSAPPQIILNTAPKPEPKPIPTPQEQFIPAKPVFAPKPVIQNSQPTQTQVASQISEPNPLTEEEKEIGSVLNNIILECDSSHYTDSIIYGQGMGAALMRLCNYNQAESYFENALAKDPDSTEVLTNLGSSLAKQGRFGAALEHYNLALKKDPKFVPALNNKANALAEMGKLEDAITIYNKILDNEPTHEIAKQNLQKAREELVQIAKLQVKEDSTSVNLDDSIPKVETTKASYAKETFEAPKTANVIEQIGSIFAGFFGFLK
ncbi:tetratricopeptide repeat protein [Candidatus Nitrosotenuis aquarius]|uniref:tetratricopeptide repeat protein n=1 Tax=Candidatus Nitrosotenuis aquarius TaxID=1846278 RepID=UPI000C1F7644|nr:tetratricopeptide repeat protein [Candidatus Nitrosotenuis aquarius]